MRQHSVMFQAMFKLLGISLGLVGTTVLGGMGLSYAHEVLYVDPTPVRAQVIAPAPVLSRATPVLTREAPVLNRAVAPDAVAAPVQLARLENGTGLTDASNDGFARTGDDVGSDRLLPEGVEGLTLSARPRLRTEQAVTRSAALDVPVSRPRATAPVRRASVQRQQVFVPPTRNQPIQRAVPQQTPRFVIGVYR